MGVIFCKIFLVRASILYPGRVTKALIMMMAGFALVLAILPATPL